MNKFAPKNDLYHFFQVITYFWCLKETSPGSFTHQSICFIDSYLIKIINRSSYLNPVCLIFISN